MGYWTTHAILELQQWRKDMDARVTDLTNNVAAMKTAIAKLGTDLAAVQAQLQNGIDTADAAAIAQANTDLAAAVAAVEALDTSLQPAPAPAPVATA